MQAEMVIFQDTAGGDPTSRVLTLWSLIVKGCRLFLPNLCVIWGKGLKLSGLQFSHF